jgi:hypothetical protein
MRGASGWTEPHRTQRSVAGDRGPSIPNAQPQPNGSTVISRQTSVAPGGTWFVAGARLCLQLCTCQSTAGTVRRGGRDRHSGLSSRLQFAKAENQGRGRERDEDERGNWRRADRGGAIAVLAEASLDMENSSKAVHRAEGRREDHRLERRTCALGARGSGRRMGKARPEISTDVKVEPGA